MESSDGLTPEALQNVLLQIYKTANQTQNIETAEIVNEMKQTILPYYALNRGE